MARGQSQTGKPLTEAQKAAKKAEAEAKKKANFIRMFEARIGKACHSIGLVGNCAGVGYSYTKQQSDQGMIAMAEKVKSVSALFNTTGTTKVKAGFVLKPPEASK